MEIMFYVVGLLMIGITLFQIVKIRQSGNITEQGWSEIRIIAYTTIDNLMGMFTVKTNKEAFIKYVIGLIREKIVNSDKLNDIDKNFWTEARLTAIFRPVMLALIDKIEELKK
jgi:hypothetical protein